MDKKERRKRRMRLKIFLALISTMLLASTSGNLLNTVGAEKPLTTTIFTDSPTVQATEIGQNFTININISNIANLYAWQTGITFNLDVLEFTGFYEGEFLKRGGSTLFLKHWKDVNNTLGIVYFRGCCLLGPVSGVNGSGQLAYVTFRSIGTGVSDFHLTDIVLINSQLEIIEFELMETLTVKTYGINYGVGIVNNLTGIQNAPDPPISGTFNPTFSREDKKISFNELSAYDWFCEVTIPKALLKCDALSDWTVRVNGSSISYAATENATHTSLHFTHENGSYTVEVIGTEAVESPQPPLGLPLEFLTGVAIAGLVALAIAIVELRKLGKYPKSITSLARVTR
jgi:hypothetical protein